MGVTDAAVISAIKEVDQLEQRLAHNPGESVSGHSTLTAGGW